MATKVISTWEQFIASTTETLTEDTTYIITNDFDLTNNVFESTISWSGGGSYRKTYTTEDTTIEGAKRINGLTYYGGDKLFKFNSQRVTFNNIHFTNCQITTGSLFTHTWTSDNATPFIRFNRCIVTGYINYLSYPANSASGGGTISPNICFYRCAFNIRGSQLCTNSGVARVTLFTECWIHFEKVGNTNYISYNGMFCQCYIEGKCTTNTYYNYYSTFYNCVINMDLSSSVAASSRYWAYSGRSWSNNYSPSVDLWYGNSYCIVNSSKLSETLADGSATLTRLTDAQIKSVSDINTLAPNFPISE